MSMLSMSENALVENMSCGAFQNRSYWGYKSSVLKSGVCKYYRREMFDKFEWCVMEMMIFGLKNVGMMTNIINRIKILIMEEILVSELDIIDMCVYVFERIDGEEEFLKKVSWMKVVCDMVKGCEKCRMVSYVNNWWKYNAVVVYEDIELNKVLKYKKKGDTSELLKLGEWLIVFVEEKSEKVIDVYNKMLKMEKEGVRYRRKDGVYLYFEILKDMFGVVSERVFDFVLKQFYKKDMKERAMFGVWLGLLCIYANKIENVCMEDVMRDVCMNDEEVVEYLFKTRNRIEVNEEFVVCDFHVNRKYGLGQFGRVGSFVENENMSLLGENGAKYKEFYILKKEEMDKENIKPKEVKVRKGKVLANIAVEEEEEVGIEKEKDEMVSFDSFELVRVIVEGVCGLKKCCIIVRKAGELYVLKEMSKAFNGGRDYMFMDDVKKEFGILDLKMRLIKSDKGLKLKDKSIRSWKNNWEMEEKEVVYCMMRFYENWGDLNKYKNILKDENKVREMLKIRLFDGLFRSSDNILRNILVLKSGELLSIDENDIFGKREHIFGKNDWCLNSDVCKRMYGEIVDELLDGERKKERLIGKLREYGFEAKVEEFVNRWDNYREIVGKEFV